MTRTTRTCWTSTQTQRGRDDRDVTTFSVNVGKSLKFKRCGVQTSASCPLVCLDRDSRGEEPTHGEGIADPQGDITAGQAALSCNVLHNPLRFFIWGVDHTKFHQLFFYSLNTQFCIPFTVAIAYHTAHTQRCEQSFFTLMIILVVCVKTKLSSVCKQVHKSRAYQLYDNSTTQFDYLR